MLRAIRPGVFVTATDTGVGKTAVAAALAAVLKELGRDVGVMKPVATGCAKRAGQLVSEDAACLIRAAECDDPTDLVCPVRLKAPLAPTVAARLEGTRVDLRAVRRAYAELRRRHRCVIVEGIGGLLVPVTDSTSVADLANEMGLPLLVVARPALGTINHTRLTIEAAKRRGLRVLGIVVNRFPPKAAGLAERTSPAEITRATRVPVVAVLKNDPRVDVARGRIGGLAKELRKQLGL